jgi:AsmA protein
MRRFLKWLFIGLGGLIGLLAAFVIVVVLVVDPNDYRGTIAEQVEQRTGRTMVIEGDLGLTFFPWFGIEMGKTRLADAEGFGDEPFAAMDRVQLAVKVWPLLSGDLRLDTVILERPRIQLIRDAQGRANWEQFPQGEPAAESAESTSGSGGDSGLPPMVQGLQLAGVRVQQARLVYDDRQAGQTITLDPLNLQLSDVRFGSDIPIEADWQVAMSGGPQLGGDLSAKANIAPDLSQVRVDSLVMNLTAEGNAVPAGEQTLSVDAGINANLAASEFGVENLVLEAAGARVEGQAKARLTPSGPTANGKLAIPELSPRKVMGNLGLEVPETRDDKVLRAFSTKLEFGYEQGRIQVKPFEARFDDSRLVGQALVRDPAQPAADFDFELDRLDVDRYLPPPSEAEDEAPEGDGEEARIPTEPLRRLDLDGEVRVGALTVSGADMEDITVKVTAKDGNIRLNPLTANLYGGQYEGDIRLDATGEKLGVTVNERLQGIQAQPLLRDLAGFARLIGQGDFTLDATTRGATVTEILDGLKGKAVFGFNNGSIDGINLAQMLRQAMARFQGNKAAADEPEKTDFTTLGGTVRIDGGTLSNDDLNLKTPLLRVTGGGSANVIKRELDYRLNLNVVSSLEGQGGADLQQLKGIPIPLRISGAFMSPSFDLALGEQLRAAAQGKLDAEKAKLKAKAEDKRKELEAKAKKKAQDALKEKAGDETKKKVEDAVGDKLKGLFN